MFNRKEAQMRTWSGNLDAWVVLLYEKNYLMKAE